MSELPNAVAWELVIRPSEGHSLLLWTLWNGMMRGKEVNMTGPLEQPKSERPGAT